MANGVGVVEVASNSPLVSTEYAVKTYESNWNHQMYCNHEFSMILT